MQNIGVNMLVNWVYSRVIFGTLIITIICKSVLIVHSQESMNTLLCIVQSCVQLYSELASKRYRNLTNHSLSWGLKIIRSRLYA